MLLLISLSDVSDLSGMNKYVITRVLHEKMNTNFYHWVNDYRITEAKQLLIKPENHKFTIEAISQMSGFKSKSVFNPLFKDKTGITPSKYRKDILV